MSYAKIHPKNAKFEDSQDMNLVAHTFNVGFKFIGIALSSNQKGLILSI